MLKLVALVVPLGLDTFAVSAALGLAGASRRTRLRASLVFPAFEAAMPALGLVAGRGLGALLGSAADWAAIALVACVGAYLLLEEDGGAARLAEARGAALLALAVGVSLDELAIGFSLGLLGLGVWLALALIAAQALLFAQLGLWVGARLGRRARESAERLAGAVLLLLALALGIEKLL
jgi:putative Mn2+ efflux pump MntP